MEKQNMTQDMIKYKKPKPDTKTQHKQESWEYV